MGTRQQNRDEVAGILSKNLRAARERLGLTQAEVAERVNYSFEFYGRCERGVAVPSVSMLVVIAEVLEVTVDELLGTAPAPVVLPEPFAKLSPEQAEIGRMIMALDVGKRRFFNKLLVYRNKRDPADEADDDEADEADPDDRPDDSEG